jgi:hypothetical protein
MPKPHPLKPLFPTSRESTLNWLTGASGPRQHRRWRCALGRSCRARKGNKHRGLPAVLSNTPHCPQAAAAALFGVRGRLELSMSLAQAPRANSVTRRWNEFWRSRWRLLLRHRPRSTRALTPVRMTRDDFSDWPDEKRRKRAITILEALKCAPSHDWKSDAGFGKPANGNSIQASSSFPSPSSSSSLDCEQVPSASPRRSPG